MPSSMRKPPAPGGVVRSIVDAKGPVEPSTTNTEPLSERTVASGGAVRYVLEVIGGTAKKLGLPYTLMEQVYSGLRTRQLIVHNGKIVTMDDYGVNTNTGRTVQAFWGVLTFVAFGGTGDVDADARFVVETFLHGVSR